MTSPTVRRLVSKSGLDAAMTEVAQQPLSAFAVEQRTASVAAVKDAVGIGGFNGSLVLPDEVPMSGRIGGRYALGLGDSITNGSLSSNAASHSFRPMVVKTLGLARLTNFTNGGVPGNTSAQALARLDALLAAEPGLKVLFVLIGTNDAGQGVPVATFKANIIAIKAKADAAKVRLVLGLVPPRAAAATAANALVRQYNAWLRVWCLKFGIPLADTWGALADPATGALSALYDTAAPDGTGGAGDGTHPNNAGHAAMAAAIAPVLAPLCPPMLPWPLVAAGNGLMTDPLGIASGYGVIAGPTTNAAQTIITRTEWPEMLAPSGRRIVIDNSAGTASTSTTVGRSVTTGYAPGDRLLALTQVRGVGGQAPPKVQIMDGATVKSVALDAPFPASVGPIAAGYTVPVGGVATLRLAVVFVAGIGEVRTIDVAGLDVLNLTQLGIAEFFV